MGALGEHFRHIMKNSQKTNLSCPFFELDIGTDIYGSGPQAWEIALAKSACAWYE